MPISGDYANPVTVNGFSCKNCTEVDEAKKHIDPSHPKDGPYGINATDKVATSHGPGVVLGGRLAGLSFDLRSNPRVVAPTARTLDISV